MSTQGRRCSPCSHPGAPDATSDAVSRTSQLLNGNSSLASMQELCQSPICETGRRSTGSLSLLCQTTTDGLGMAQNMTAYRRSRWTRRLMYPVAVLLMLLTCIAGVALGGTSAGATTQEPCDIFSTAGDPCVAAYSTVRALFSSYDGPLYQVQRASDG